MQIVSWQTGSAVAIDNPACADPVLAHVVRYTNDTMCATRDGKMLCPECSLAILGLADRTVGTRMVDRPAREEAFVHAQLAVEQAEQVESLLGIPWAQEAIGAAWQCLRDSDAASVCQSALAITEQADVAVENAGSNSAKDAVRAAKDAMHASARASATSGMPVLRSASTAITNALAAVGTQAGSGRLDEAHRVIDRFTELTGLPERDPLVTSDATPALA
jgi:hypothetical protein